MSSIYDPMSNMAMQQAAARPEYIHETNARSWAGAKNRLDEASRKLAEAASEESAARAAEEQAWQDLHESSGRAPKRDIPSKIAGLAKPYFPPDMR